MKSCWYLIFFLRVPIDYARFPQNSFFYYVFRSFDFQYIFFAYFLKYLSGIVDSWIFFPFYFERCVTGHHFRPVGKEGEEYWVTFVIYISYIKTIAWCSRKLFFFILLCPDQALQSVKRNQKSRWWNFGTESYFWTQQETHPHWRSRFGIFIAYLFRPVSSFGGQRQCHIGTLGHVNNIYSQILFLDCNKTKLIRSILLNSSH